MFATSHWKRNLCVKKTGKNAKWVAPLFVSAILAGCFINGPVKAQKPELNLNEYIFPLTRDQYPRVYEKWGKAGFIRINAMLVPALKKAYAAPTCDSIDWEIFSEDRSAEDNKPTILVQCKNMTRFYFTEADLKPENPAVSQQEKTPKIGKSVAIPLCDELVKKSLTHPSTFDPSMWSYSVKDGMFGALVVTFDFKAKNSYGLELSYGARCVFDDKGIHPPEIQEK